MRGTITLLTIAVLGITSYGHGIGKGSYSAIEGLMTGGGSGCGGVYRQSETGGEFMPVVSADSISWEVAAYDHDGITGISEKRVGACMFSRTAGHIKAPFSTDSDIRTGVASVMPALMCHEPKADCFYAWIPADGASFWAFLDARSLTPKIPYRTWNNNFRPVAMTRTVAGVIYAVGDDGILYRLHPDTGNATMVGPLGMVPSMAVQSICYDEVKEVLYWAAQGEHPGIYAVDPHTGNAELSTPFKRGEVFSAIAPVGRKLSPRAPAKPRAPVFVPYQPGDTTGKVTLVIPARNMANKPFDSPVGMSLFIDGEIAGEYMGEPGALLKQSVALEPGEHYLAVVAYDGNYVSEVSSSRIFAGYDIPESPSQVEVVYQQEGIEIVWNNVLYDRQGARLDSDAVTYSVVRRPEGKMIARQIKGAYASDDLSESLPRGRHYYEVVCHHGEDVSKPAVSDELLLGRTYMPDYTIDFRNHQDATDFDLQGSRGTWNIRSDGVLYGDGKEETLRLPPLRLDPSKIYSLELDIWAAADSAAVEVKVSGIYNDAEAYSYGTVYDYIGNNDRTKMCYEILPARAGNCSLNFEFSYDESVCLGGLKVSEVCDIKGPEGVTDMHLKRIDGYESGLSFRMPSIAVDGSLLSGNLKVCMVTNLGDSVCIDGLPPGEIAELPIKNPEKTEYLILQVTDSSDYSGRSVTFYPHTRYVAGSFLEEFNDTRWLSDYDCGEFRPPVLEIKSGELHVGGGATPDSFKATVPLPVIVFDTDSLYMVEIAGRSENCDVKLVSRTVSAKDTICGFKESPVLFEVGSGSSFEFEISGDGLWNAYIDRIRIRAYGSKEAPAASENAVAETLEEGAHRVRLRLNAPSRDIAGRMLSGNMDIEIRRTGDAQAGAMITGVEPGADVEWIDCGAPADVNCYDILARNESGYGLPAQASVFAGWDMPGFVGNLTASGCDEKNSCLKLTWTPPKQGMHGAPYKMDKLRYNVYSEKTIGGHLESRLLASGLAETEYVRNIGVGSQQEHVYKVCAVADGLEGEGAAVIAVLGEPLLMNECETFADGKPQLDVWTSGAGWEIRKGADIDEAVVTDGGAACGVADDSYLLSPIFNLTDGMEPLLSLNVMPVPKTVNSQVKLALAFCGDNNAVPFAEVELESYKGIRKVDIPLGEYIHRYLLDIESGISPKKVRFGFKVKGNSGDGIIIDNITFSGKYVGIDNIGEDGRHNDRLYDMQGRPLNHDIPAGIPVIRNGRAVIFK